MLLLLAACGAPPPPADAPARCPTPVTDGWAPATEVEVRMDGASAAWEAVDGARVTVSADGVTVEGPGAAETTVVIDRGETYTLHGAVDGPGTVTVRQLGDDGLALTLVEATLPGPGVFTLPVTPTRSGETLEIELGADAVATFRGVELRGRQWADVGLSPRAPLQLGFLIHTEADATLLTDQAKWARRAAVFEGLSGVLSAHGAALTVQPDVSFLRATSGWDPTWFDARADEGMAWSVHLHDEDGGAEQVEQAAKGAVEGFRGIGESVTDVNGGFGVGAWDALAALGLRSVTAFKDDATQAGLPLSYTGPWRLSPDASTDDLQAFIRHDPAGPVVYLPGDSRREPDHARFPDFARRSLSQAGAHADPARVNTWYFVLHVNEFGPQGDAAAADTYFADGSFEGDLAAYDRFLTEIADPLVAEGALTYGTPDTMLAAWEAWEEGCTAE